MSSLEPWRRHRGATCFSDYKGLQHTRTWVGVMVAILQEVVSHSEPVGNAPRAHKSTESLLSTPELPWMRMITYSCYGNGKADRWVARTSGSANAPWAWE